MADSTTDASSRLSRASPAAEAFGLADGAAPLVLVSVSAPVASTDHAYVPARTVAYTHTGTAAAVNNNTAAARNTDVFMPAVVRNVRSANQPSGESTNTPETIETAAQSRPVVPLQTYPTTTTVPRTGLSRRSHGDRLTRPFTASPPAYPAVTAVRSAAVVPVRIPTTGAGVPSATAMPLPATSAGSQAKAAYPAVAANNRPPAASFSGRAVRTAGFWSSVPAEPTPATAPNANSPSHPATTTRDTLSGGVPPAANASPTD